MSLAEQAVGELAAAQEYFNRSTRNLPESLSGFAPAPGMMTAAQMVAHVAQTLDWFVEGAFRAEGFDMDFEAMSAETNGYESLTAARGWFEKSVAEASATLGSKSDAELMELLPAGPIMGGMPRMAIIGAITDHTAHHRGALSVYARLNGIVPPMPYMDM